MEIVILSQTSVWGGAEAHAVGLAEALATRGHSPMLVCADGATFDLYEKAASGRVPLEKLRNTKPLSEHNWLDWLRQFRRFPNAACIYEKGTLHSGSLALDVAARSYFRRFVTIEQLEPLPLPPKTSRRYLRGLLPGLGFWWYQMRYRGYSRSWGPHTIVTVSDSVRTLLLRDYMFPRKKVVTVWNGTDPGRYRPDASVRARLLRHWGVDPGAFVFGSVRRFTWEKGLDLAIEAFRIFCINNPTLRTVLVLVGDGSARAALEQQAATAGISDRVLFPGFTAEPWTIYPALDVFLLPSRQEALSVALTEAMASGCLPIAFRVGGSEEVISDSGLGWVVPAGDPRALSDAMGEAASLDDAERAAMRERVRAHVRSEFNSVNQYAKIASLVES
jgi:glycosyltransferase involved in cell wall biosynthesis